MAKRVLMKISKAGRARLRKRAQEAMSDPKKWTKFSISPEAVIALLDAAKQ